MSRYRISRQAETDLEEIADYIADFNPTAAFDVIDTLHDTFAFLAKNPDAGTLRDDLRPRLRIFSRNAPRTTMSSAFIRYPTASKSSP